jgi:hypothetical protein
MLYALLAYHVETEVASWSQAEDAALMVELNKVHDRLTAEGRMGPAARLDYTGEAVTLRGGVVTDGPFAETKEQLLGFYILDFPDRDAAVAAVRELQKVNPSAVYEIRPIIFHLTGAPVL